ncbi:lymphocyte antigen 96-like isoform X3 [Pelobates fuscus]
MLDIDFWHQSMKVSETRMVICSGDHDEYDFRGHLKGDERNPPIILFEPCVYSINGKFRTSISWIPKMNLHRLSVSVDIWYGPMTVSERRTILCSGEHDEFDFCGTLKGETVHTWIEGRFKQFNFAKGTYTINFNAFAGEQEECIFCGTINLTIKV